MANDKNFRDMADFERMRVGLIIATLASILVISIIITVLSNFWFGFVGFGGIATLLFARASFRSFSANPPTKWIPQVMGFYVNELKSWGPTLLPWIGPLTINYTEMPGGIMHADFAPKEMIPGDRVTVVIPIHLVYEIDNENPVQVIHLGGVEKAANLLREYLDKLTRLWITHPVKGPRTLGKGKQKMTLDRVRGMNNEVTNHILEELARDDIAVINSDIPVEALMGYFGKRQLWPHEQQWVNKIEQLSEDEKAELRAEVKQRMEDIEAIRSGKKPLRIHSVGLIVRQIVVADIEADGPSAAAVARVADAHFDAEINLIKATNLAEQAKILREVTHMDGAEVALINNGTVKKTITETKLDASSPLLATVQLITRAAIDAIFNRTPVTDRKEAGNGNNADTASSSANGK